MSQRFLNTLCLMAILANGFASKAAESVWFGDNVPNLQLEIALPETISGAEKERIPGKLTRDGVEYKVEVKLRDVYLRPVGVEKDTNWVMQVFPANGGSKPECSFELVRRDQNWCRMTCYAGALLARRMGVPVPRVSHALLQVNKRPLGVYIMKEWVSPQSGMASLVGRRGFLWPVGDSGKQQTEVADLENVVRCKKAVAWFNGGVLPAQATFMEAKQIFDVNALCRVMVWESFAQTSLNHFDVDTNAWLFLDQGTGMFEAVPREISLGFQATQIPLFIERQGLSGKAMMSSVEGRHLWLDHLERITSDLSVEDGLISSLKTRVQQIRPHVRSAKEGFAFDNAWKNLETVIHDQFKQAREIILKMKGLDDKELENYKLAKVQTTSGSVKGTLNLSARSTGNTVVDRFISQVRINSMGNPSGGIKFYSLGIQGVPGELENLSVEATNWVKVNITNGNEVLKDVGLRLKGRITRENFKGKPSVTLKVNQLTKGQSLDGMSKVHLNNSVMDPTYMNEYLGALLFEKAGLPCPKVFHARVSVNGLDYGLYPMVEGCSKPFLKRKFNREDGLLFEGLSMDINGQLDLDNGKPPLGYDGLMQLDQSAREAIRTGKLEPLAARCDVEKLARFIALEVLLGHGDGYTLAVNNYRIYQPITGGKFVLIPHGMDNLLLDRPPELFPQVRGILAQALLGTESGKEFYLHAFQDILERVCVMDQIVPTMAFECARIAKQTGAPEENVKQSAKLMERLAARRDLLVKKLAAVGYSQKK